MNFFSPVLYDYAYTWINFISIKPLQKLFGKLMYGYIT